MDEMKTRCPDCGGNMVCDGEDEDGDGPGSARIAATTSTNGLEMTRPRCPVV